MAFKMKGHTLPGIKQDKSVAFKNYKNPRDYEVFNMGNEASPSFKKEDDKKY